MRAGGVAVGTRTQLFVDDFLIAESEGVSERLHSMTRLPEPVLQAAAPWERPAVGGLWGAANALYDPDERQFRMWYQSLGAYPALPPADPGYQCYVESPDGLHWERPNLGLFDYEGSTANNIIGASSRGYGPAHGMLDCAAMAPVEPPEVRFKSVGCEARDAEGRITHGVSFSPDGVKWRPYEHNPILSGYQRGDASSAAMLQFGPTPEGPADFPRARYAVFPKMHVEIGQQSHDVPWRRRCWAVCTSVDDAAGLPFTNWTEPMLVLAPDQRDDDMAVERLEQARPLLLRQHPDDYRCEFYGLVVWRSGDTFLGMLWVYDAALELSRIGGWQRVRYRRGTADREPQPDPMAARRQPATGDCTGRVGHVRQPHDLLPLAPADRRGRVVGVLRGVQRGPRRQSALRRGAAGAILGRHPGRAAALPGDWVGEGAAGRVRLARRRGCGRHADDAVDGAGREPAGGQRDHCARWGADGGGAG